MGELSPCRGQGVALWFLIVSMIAFRMCVDYCRLIQSTVREAVSGARWFSCLDLVSSGYWQMPVAAKVPPKIGFSPHRGQFQWKVMPFGLTKGATSSTHLVNLPLDGLAWTYCLVYVGDITVWLASFDGYLHHLCQVFHSIRKAGLKLKPAKCQFLKK